MDLVFLSYEDPLVNFPTLREIALSLRKTFPFAEPVGSNDRQFSH